MTFDEAFDRVIGHEGGYVNNPSDPGGETKWGISKRSYPRLDIRSLTRDDAKSIYYTDFWLRVKGIPHDSVKFQMFDAAFNHGYGNAIRMLQRAVMATDDGYWGPLSQAAYNRMQENDILLRFIGYRLKFFTGLSTFDVFGRGWAARIANNLLYAAKDNHDG